MPNRVVREGILDSDRVNRLSWECEVFYRRLMSIVDDYGRFDGRVSVIRSKLFPLRLDKVTTDLIESWIHECVSVKLIARYKVENKPYLEILDFNQSVRIKRPKFPPNPDRLTNEDHQEDVPLESTETPKSEVNSIPHQTFNLKPGKAEQYFQEFYNSPDLDLVCMQGNIDKSEALRRLSEFKPLMNLTYKNSLDFANHFKNWMIKKGYTKTAIKGNTESVGTFGRKHFRTEAERIEYFKKNPKG